MAKDRIAAAQRGIAYADVAQSRPKAASKAVAGSGQRRGKRPHRAATPLTGPLLSPGSLTAAERTRLIDGIETVIEGVYTHLPLKRARYGVDPIQRLRILRSQLAELTDDGFHFELADILTRLRDAHTRYTGPNLLANKVAALPFLVEMYGPTSAPTYVVTKAGHGLDSSFKPGVSLEYWNGMPIDRAVQRYSDQEVGGRPDSQRACAVQSLTLRSLQYGPPPDEHWVVVGYRTAPANGGAGQSKEIKIPWQIVDPSDITPLLTGGPTGNMRKALRLTRAVDPAAEAVRRAKMLLFAPGALTGTQAKAPMRSRKPSRNKTVKAAIIPTRLTETLKVMSIDAPGGPFGYLRIWGFDADPTPFMKELLRLIPLLPNRGLILDIRGNPGGYIWAAELALQLFTPNHIEPTRFSALATPFTRKIATIGDLVEDLGPWKESLEAAVRNGEMYAQSIPITESVECNAIGQQYGGPVVLVGDSTSYSAGDLFAAGFVDNAIGPFLCVGAATGAGGANVWDYADLRQALANSPAALPLLPDGIGLSFSFRRATRSGPSEGIPIEDVGVEGMPYALTRNDLLNGNSDLIAECIRILKQLPFTQLSATLDRASRSISIATAGLDLLDVFIDGHPASTTVISAGTTTTISYPASAREVEITAFAENKVRQRRRIPVSVRP